MTRVTIAAGLLKGLARGASLLYPRDIRRAYGDAFPEVVAHRFALELTRRPTAAAALATLQVIVADTFAAVPAAWKERAVHGSGQATPGSSLPQRLRSQFNGLGGDLKLTVRTALRRPGVTLLVVATLGVGIGASTAAFDALDRAVLNPLPYGRNADFVLLVMEENKFKGFYGVPLAQFHDWRGRATTLERIEVFRRSSATRQRPEGADVLEAINVSGGLPGMLGLVPRAGRMYTPADGEPSAPATIMLTERFWRRDYGGDPSIVGKQITLGTTPTEVIGIWPDDARLDFHGPVDAIRLMANGKEYNDGSWVQVLARVAPGRSRQEVEAELAGLTPQSGDAGRTYRAVAVRPADLLLGPAFVTGVWLVFGGGLLLLAGALSNTAHLLLERAFARHHELAIRRAVGASSGRVARLFVVEGTFFGIAGLLFGGLVALGLERLITVYEPRLFGEVAGAGLGGRAFGFAAAAGGAAILACTLAPVWRSRRRDLVDQINRGHSRGSTGRSRSALCLVSAQAAFAVILVSGAALLGHSLLKLLAVDPGMAVHELAELSVSLPSTRYSSPESRRLYATRAEEALRSLPGVTGIVRSGMPILTTSMMSGVPHLDGEAEPQGAGNRITAVNGVPPAYFEVTGMRMLEGRTFATDETRAVVVSERFAARRAGSVIGRTLYLPGRAEGWQIVGVVKDAALMGVADTDRDRAAVYTPDTSRADSFIRFIIRTTGDATDVLRGARQRLAEIDATVPVRAPQTGSDVIRQQTAQHRFVAVLLGGLAVFGFALAMSGVYGAVALSVVRRTREVGVRMALGASAERLVRQFVGQGLMPVLAGALAGTIIVLLAAPRAEPLLFQIDARDPVSGLLGVTVVLLTAALAAFVPARRITRLDPAHTLRD